MKPKVVFYAVYMILSILVSITVAAIPAVILLLIAYQSIDAVFTAHGGPLTAIPGYVRGLLGSLVPEIFYDRFWFLLLLVPILFFCYAIFLGLLLGMFKLSRRGIPELKDGYYPMETGEWLIYEFKQVYYVIFPYFAWFFSVFMDTKPRHMAFGAQIGPNTVVGNGRLFNPERTVIGSNCFFGYDAILSGHVYEGDRLYLKTVRLGNGVTVGANAVVLPGVTVGDNVIIGANSTVPKDCVIPSNSIWIHGKVIPRVTVAPQMPPSATHDAGVTDTPANGEHI
ncbi:MAG: hypothetical protein HXY34_07975 [Candidatus Thorarchaeota archaeon]|nr:hypothetical protein [Candidatus Thorarchaeota archaeon]